MTSNSRPSIRLGAIFLIFIIACFWFIMPSSPSDNEPKPQSTLLSHWQDNSSFSQARRAFASATNSRHIYVVGGVDASEHYLTTVEYAAILTDGTLGPWQTTSPLNEGRFYLATVIIDNYIYAIGGANGPLGEDNIPSASVERALILPDGNLGPWQRQAYLTSPRRGLQSVAYGKHIYALGGYNGIFMKTVERADIDAEGNITGWTEEQSSFIVDRYIHSAAIHSNRIYLIAGHVEKQDIVSYSDVESAVIQENGELSPWKIEKSRLNTPRFIAAATSSRHHLYIAGGHDGANRLTSVEYAPFLPDGSLGNWQQTLPLKVARSATTMVNDKNTLYILGGAGGDNVLNSVESSQHKPTGALMAIQAPTSTGQ